MLWASQWRSGPKTSALTLAGIRTRLRQRRPDVVLNGENRPLGPSKAAAVPAWDEAAETAEL